VDKQTDLISRLQDEADLCRNDGATDIAALLDEAVIALRDCQMATRFLQALPKQPPTLHSGWARYKNECADFVDRIRSKLTRKT
jgi:hypothetical protein